MNENKASLWCISLFLSFTIFSSFLRGGFKLSPNLSASIYRLEKIEKRRRSHPNFKFPLLCFSKVALITYKTINSVLMSLNLLIMFLLTHLKSRQVPCFRQKSEFLFSVINCILTLVMRRFLASFLLFSGTGFSLHSLISIESYEFLFNLSESWIM